MQQAWQNPVVASPVLVLYGLERAIESVPLGHPGRGVGVGSGGTRGTPKRQ